MHPFGQSFPIVHMVHDERAGDGIGLGRRIPRKYLSRTFLALFSVPLSKAFLEIPPARNYESPWQCY